jgi:hypothetical protein
MLSHALHPRYPARRFGNVKAQTSNSHQTLQNLITILARANVRQVRGIVQLNEAGFLYD